MLACLAAIQLECDFSVEHADPVSQHIKDASILLEAATEIALTGKSACKRHCAVALATAGHFASECPPVG